MSIFGALVVRQIKNDVCVYIAVCGEDAARSSAVSCSLAKRKLAGPPPSGSVTVTAVTLMFFDVGDGHYFKYVMCETSYKSKDEMTSNPTFYRFPKRIPSILSRNQSSSGRLFFIVAKNGHFR